MDLVLLEKLYSVYDIAIAVCGTDGQISQAPADKEFVSPFLTDPDHMREIIGAGKEKEGYLFFENGKIGYGVIRIGGDRAVIAGPVIFSAIEKKDILKYQHGHKMGGKSHIKQVEPEKFTRYLSLLCYLLTGKDCKPESFEIANHIESAYQWATDAALEAYQLSASEMDIDHQATDYEDSILDIVSSGNIGEMEKLVRSVKLVSMAGHEGKMARSDKKQAEYMSVAMITLLTRAAVMGGVHREEAHTKGDLYLLKLETCDRLDDMQALIVRAQYEFTQMVYQAKKKNSRVYYVEQCKDYIARNLRKPIKIGDIALNIGINRTYLARRFTECEGLTIQQYLMKERCLHAANLLKYSSYSISIIAEYFCFSSQSHFGKQFKNYMGITPKEYRAQYKASNF